jgi:hypothetical protein
MKTSCWLKGVIGRATPGKLLEFLTGPLAVLALVLSGFSAAAQDNWYPPPNDDSATRPPVAVVTVKAVDPYASEPCVTTVIDEGKFVISRSYYTNIDMTVYFKLGGTASNGVDYVIPTTRTPNSVVIPKGQWSVELPVRALADNLMEGVETVVLRIEPIVCIAIYPPPPGCYQIGQPAEAVVFIRDCPQVSRPPYVAIHEPKDGTFYQSPVDIPIVARTVDPEGYCWKAEFFAGSKSIGTSVVAFLVAPTNGTPVDFGFDWKNVPAGRHELMVRATSSRGVVGVSRLVRIAVGPIFTERVPEVSVTATEPLAIEGANCWGWPSFTNRYPEGAVQYTNIVASSGQTIWWFTNCGPKNATFTIRRTGPTNESLQVFFSLRGTAINGLDYEQVAESVVIPAGERRAQVLIVPKEDEVIEAPESVILELAPPLVDVMPPPYVVARPARAGAIIVDSSMPYLRPGILPGRLFYLSRTAAEFNWLRIERSTNLVHWETIATNQVLQGSLHYLDPDSETADMLFYRAVPVEPPVED